MNEMLKQFNLPNFIDGLSFADASKKIQSRFKERTDPESVATEKEMLGRLKQMQEHVKEQQQAKEAEQNPPQEGDMMAEDPSQMGQPTEETPQDEGDFMGQIQNAFGGNEFAFGGGEDPIKTAKSAVVNQVIRETGIAGLPTDSNMDFDTKQIVRYQPGVVSGQSGKRGFYLYSKNVGEPGFDPSRHREFVNQEEMGAVQRTPQWKQYMQGQSKLALGGEEEYDPHATPDTAEQRFAPTIGANNISTTDSITSLGKTASTAGAASKGPGIGGYAAMATTAIDLGQEAFGPTGVDTSGRAHVEKKKAGSAALAGAAKGASAGMVLGPWGAAAGAVIGGAAGFIGAKKQQKDAAIANRNATYADAAVNDNQFALGGDEDKYKAGRIDPKTKKRIAIEQIPLFDSKGLNMDKKTVFTGDKDADRDLLANYTKENKLGKIDTSNLSRKKAAPITAIQRLKLAGMDVKEVVDNNKDVLRYAPALGNMLQLAKLQKPEQETTPELNTRYKKNVVDEKGLINLVREETSANREAILGSSEGSGNAARANLLGTQLNSTKALSDAFMKISEANARENNQEQAFNLGVDTTNLQQQTLAQDIRARNKGAYDTEKSRLQTAVGADLGGIGQEELYKKFPELMGASYDWKGKYKKLKEEADTKTSKAA